MIRVRPTATILILVILTILAGCSTTSKPRGGGYYKDDGPGRLPADIQNIPNATPRIETYNPANSKPYVVFGKRYVPTNDDAPFQQEGMASWYGKKFHGDKTANGESYDMYAMTAAHPTLPIPSYARVTRVSNGKSIIVRINDRGPFLSNRIIDLSYVAAAKLGLLGPGSGEVVVQAITNDDIRNNDLLIAKTQPVPPPTMASNPSPDALAPIQKQEAPPEKTPPDPPIVNSASTNNAALLTASSFQPRDRPARPASPTTATQVIARDADGIYLQFGAFSGEDNATRLARTLNQHIGSIEARRASVQTIDHLHKVQIGPYPNRTAAVNAAARIEEATGMQPTIAAR